MANVKRCQLDAGRVAAEVIRAGSGRTSVRPYIGIALVYVRAS